MVCCLTLERPGWWSRAARWLEAAREELVWRLEPEPTVVIPMSADRAREELNRRAEELLDEAHPNFDQRLDPKSSWAVAHLEQFPVEVMRADLETLLRVPGIGPVSARRILSARRQTNLRFEDLKKLGVVVNRAQFFLTCGGRMRQGLHFSPATLSMQLERMEERDLLVENGVEQLSLFDSAG